MREVALLLTLGLEGMGCTSKSKSKGRLRQNWGHFEYQAKEFVPTLDSLRNRLSY